MSVSVGSVSVDVVPSATTFSRDLRQKLLPQAAVVGKEMGKRISEEVGKALADAPVSAPVEKYRREGEKAGGAFGYQAREAIKEALAALPKVDITADSSDVDRKIDNVRRELVELKDKRIGIDISAKDADTKLSRLRTELTEVARRREATVDVKANTLGAIAEIDKFRVKAAAIRDIKVPVDIETARADGKLALLRFKLDEFKRKQTEAKVSANVTSAMTSIGELGKKVAMLAPLAAAATYAFSSLGAAIVPSVGIVAALPGAILVGVGALGALKLATSGVGSALKDAFDPTKAKQFNEELAKLPPETRQFVRDIQSIGPQWRAVKNDAHEALFSGVGGDIKVLSAQFLPEIRARIVDIAKSFNDVEYETARWIHSTQGASVIHDILLGVQNVIYNVTRAFSPLIQAFLTIGAIAMPILDRISQGAGGVAQRFSQWTQSAAGVQRITGWINGAIIVFEQLGRIAVNVGRILGSLFRGAQESGSNFLGTLERVTRGISDALRTPSGASQLSQVFGMIRDVISAVWQKIVTLWPAIRDTGTAFFSLFTAASPVSDLFYKILVPVIQMFADGVKALSPILGPLIAVLWLWEIAIWAVNVALDANPVVLIGLAIIGLVGAVIYAYQHFTWFRTAVDAVGTALGWVYTNILTPVGHFFQAVFGPVIRWIGDNWSWLSTVLGVIAGPVGWIILLFTHFHQVITFLGGVFTWLWQSVIVPVWNGISAAVGFAWTNIIKPVFDALWWAIRLIGAIIVTVLVTPFVIAWHAIAAIVQWAWSNVLVPIWYGAIVPALRFLGSVFTWLWVNAIVPAWNGIVIAAQWAWSVLQFIWYNAIVPALHFLGSVFSWLWVNIIVPAWNGITAAVSWAWGILSSIWYGAIVPALQFLGSVFSWLWNNIIVPVWNGITNAINVAWGIISGIFNVLMNAVHSVGDTFQSVADWIARAWDTIKNATRAPVQFVVDVVYNNGIRTVWNGIAGLFGMAQLAPVHFAGGGVLPGYAPGVDSVPAMLSAGEGVLVPEAVQGLGPSFVGWANNHFSGGRSSGGAGTGFSEGGIAAGGVPRFAGGGIMGDIGSFLSASGDFLMGLFTDPAKAVRDLFGKVTGDSNNIPGRGSPWSDSFKQLPVKTIDAIIKKAEDWIKSLMAMGAGGGAGVARWSGVALEALALAGQPASMLPLLLMQMNSESSGNPGAVNGWDVNARAGHPSVGLMQVIPTTFADNAGPLRGLGIMNPLANIYAAIMYTLRTYGSLQRGWHGHGYDSGGIAGGVGMMPKYTLQPERVLSPQQTQSFDTLVRNLDTGRTPLFQNGAASGSGQQGGSFTGNLYLDSGEFMGKVNGSIGAANQDVSKQLNYGRV